MPCQEWFDLVEQYRNAVHFYGTAVDRFRGEAPSDWEGLWRQAELARRNADRARGAFQSIREWLSWCHRSGCR